MNVQVVFKNEKGFEDAVRAIARRQNKKYLDIYRKKMLKLMQELIATTPRDTGAAAGTTLGAKRGLYPSHPASYTPYIIGNQIGESGWQLRESREVGGQVTFGITNSMWDYYLKYLEYGIGPHSMHKGFIRRTWLAFLADLKGKV